MEGCYVVIQLNMGFFHSQKIMKYSKFRLPNFSSTFSKCHYRWCWSFWGLWRKHRWPWWRSRLVCSSVPAKEIGVSIVPYKHIMLGDVTFKWARATLFGLVGLIHLLLFKELRTSTMASSKFRGCVEFPRSRQPRCSES